VTILITGFGPFPGAPFNPTETLVRQLTRRPAGLGHAVASACRIGHVFRTSYAAVDAELPRLITRHRPEVVLLFGLAARTAHVRVETRAINSRSVLSADVDGFAPPKSSIDPAAPAWRAGRAPHQRLIAAAEGAGVAARLSHSAGRYLCNYAYWRALETAAATGSLVQFVHVPLVREGPAPRWRPHRSVSAGDLARAAEAMLAVLVRAASEPRRSLALTA
jgi:pyroglutamyl-peptidase